MIGVWFLFASSIEQILNLQFETVERRTALSFSLEINLFLHLQSIPSIPLHVIGPKGAEQACKFRLVLHQQLLRGCAMGATCCHILPEKHEVQGKHHY